MGEMWENFVGVNLRPPPVMLSLSFVLSGLDLSRVTLFYLSNLLAVESTALPITLCATCYLLALALPIAIPTTLPITIAMPITFPIAY
jgi:hypothetical protein